MALTSNFNITTITLIAIPFTVSAAILMWKAYKRLTYTYVGVVKALYFYPVKSLKRVEVSALECTPAGVKAHGLLDRSFMLISGDHVLLSQRQEPRLILLTLQIDGDHIFIKNPEREVLKLNIAESTKKFENVITCHIHDTEVETVDCGDAAAKFFNDFLGRNDVRLVRYDAAINKRKYIGKQVVFDSLVKENPYTFQDLSPVNLLTESSIDALNERLDEKVSEKNFRPNVFIAGSSPFEEDNWKHVKFESGAVIESILPCGRCLMTTNDPETGIKTNKEPLATLRKFRMLKDSKSPYAKVITSPCFAINCWVRKVGMISVGDTVFATIEKNRLIFKDEVTQTYDSKSS